tara:strand:+ start:717 stop:2150 length:1434 start_codon:yes stop_codon:yes gene_type:complete
MNFKRPSFRRGGSTGIGQLTPRVKANMGFPNFGVGQGDNTGYQKYLETMRANKASNKPSGIAELILGPRYTDPNFVSPFLKPDSPFFSNRTGFEFMNLGAQNDGSTTYMTSEGPKTINEVEKEKITSNSEDLDETVTGVVRPGEGVSYNVKEKITENNNDKIDLNELLGETSMKDAITDEVDILKDLLKDTGTSKGEKALILAKAVKTPGTIADKLEVGADEAVKLAKEDRKQDKALILTAYKNYKAKELADGKLNTQETAVKNYVNKKLADTNNSKSRNELELEAWEIVIKGAQGGKDINVEFATSMLAANNTAYKDALRDIQNYANKKDAASQKKVAEAQKVIAEYAEYAKIAGITIPGLNMAEGGRVNRALGTPEMGEITETVEQETVKTPTEKVQATEVTAAENIEPMKEVPVMDFATLRNRLPQEITDDVVQLLANSKEAMQDFYYINSQNDVSNFNTKYGVNLILPPAVLA